MISERRLVECAALALTIRLAVLVIGYAAIFAFGYPSGIPPNTKGSELANMQARWDAGWYIGIADGGYRPGPDATYRNTAFFPAYPLALRVVTTLVRARHRAVVFEWAGALLSIAFFVWASLYLFRLAVDRYHFVPRQATWAVALLAAYPFAVFYGAVYSESLFLLTVLATFYHADREQPLRGSVWGLLAGLTRPTGMLMSVPLLAMMWQRRFNRKGPSAWSLADALLPLAPLLGAALYSGFLYVSVGNPFVWIREQEQWGRSTHALSMDLAQLRALTTVSGAEQFLRVQSDIVVNGLSIVFVLLAAPLIAIELDWPAILFVIVSVVPGLVFGGLMSMGRFTAVLFPVFLALASLRSTTFQSVLLVVFALGQAIVSAMFFGWRSIF